MFPLRLSDSYHRDPPGSNSHSCGSLSGGPGARRYEASAIAEEDHKPADDCYQSLVRTHPGISPESDIEAKLLAKIREELPDELEKDVAERTRTAYAKSPLSKNLKRDDCSTYEPFRLETSPACYHGSSASKADQRQQAEDHACGTACLRKL